MSTKQQHGEDGMKGAGEGMDTLALVGLTVVGGIFVVVLVLLFTRQRGSSGQSSNGMFSFCYDTFIG